MDRLRKLYQKYLSELILESREKLEGLPEWKLNSFIKNIDSKNKTEKIKLIQEKFLPNDIFYSYMNYDLNQIKDSNIKSFELKVLTIDDRALEGNGYNESQKQKVYFFISEVQKIVQE